MIKPKEYLAPEMERNKQAAALFETVLKRVWGQDFDVLVGHHVTFEHHGDIKTEDEIPSADTFIFCHDILKAVFGDDRWESVACVLALTPANDRERVYAELLSAHDDAPAKPRSTHITEVA